MRPARAACQLSPEVDTIIEIGGQESKFTTLKSGAVIPYLKYPKRIRSETDDPKAFSKHA